MAKSTLDIAIVVRPQDLTETREAMVSAGYIDRGELGIPGRVAFQQPKIETAIGDRKVKHNTYAILDNSLALKNHLDLKRTLLGDSKLRDEYGEVKRKLAGQEVENVDEYCRGKTETVLKILRKAGWDKEDLEEVAKANG